MTGLGPRPIGPDPALRWLLRHVLQVRAPRLGKHLAKRLDRRLAAPEHAFDFRAETLFGFRLEGSTGDLIERFVYLFGIWEPNLTAFILRRLARGDGFVDVGANIGYFALLAAGAVGDEGCVLALEPAPDTFARLERNLALNPGRRVRAVRAAASDTAGTLNLYRRSPGNTGGSSLFASPGAAALGEVPARPLCALLTERELERARLVKIDVEGAEVEAVRGLLPCLAAARRDLELVVEVGGGPRPDPARAARALLDALAPFGFHAYALPNYYAATHYARREKPTPPRRLEGPVEQEADLVFSRINTDVL